MNNNVEQQRKHFNSISETYYHARQNNNHLLYKELMWKYFFKDIEALFSDEKYKCLEPMCGYGEGHKILKEYSTIDFEYQGFDYSEELVNLSNEKNNEISIEHGNVLNYSNGQVYNLMILIGGLHHVYDNVDLAIKNLNKMMEKGSYFINLEPTHNNMIFQKVRENIYRKNKLFDDETEQAFKLQELNDIFENNGFSIVKQIYPGLLGYILYYNPDAFKYLNLGNNKIVNIIFNFEQLFFKNFIGKYFSFATLTLWKKNI